MNCVNLIGRLGADPVRKDLGTGTTMATFSIAVDRRGEKTDWIPIVVFGKTAEFAINHLAKGRRVGVIGHLRVSDYEGKDGQKRRSWSVVSNSIVVIDWPTNKSGSSTDNLISQPMEGDDYDPFALE